MGSEEKIRKVVGTPGVAATGELNALVIKSFNFKGGKTKKNFVWPRI